MISTTIRDVVNDTVTLYGADDTVPYELYVISKKDEIAYVGKSNDVLTRIEQHLGHTDRGMSSVGIEIEKDAPTYEGWEVAFYTVAELDADVIATFMARGIATYKGGSVDFAEQHLIHKYSPPFNTSHNPTPKRWLQAREAKPSDGTANYINI